MFKAKAYSSETSQEARRAHPTWFPEEGPPGRQREGGNCGQESLYCSSLGRSCDTESAGEQRWPGVKAQGGGNSLHWKACPWKGVLPRRGR